MVDNNESAITKADIEVLLATQEQKFSEKLTAREAEFRKELDIQANKIHSSYAKKLKAANVETQEEDSTEGSPSRRPTKRELELQENLEKMVRRAEEADKQAILAKQKNTFTDLLLKNGFNPEAVDTVHTLMSAKNAFTEDGKMKVNVDGVEVALPFDSAVKQLVKSPEAKFFLAPKGANGSGSKPPIPTPSSNGNKPKLDVDWAAIAHDIGFKQ
jgi:hypothetical protein